MGALREFDVLIGRWHGTGEIPLDPPLRVEVEATVERLGELLVFRSGGDAAVPDSISIIGGRPAGEPQPMHYFDARGVKRTFLTALDDRTWSILRSPDEDWNGPDGPGFNQRFIGELSEDGSRIEGRWERGMGDAGDEWQIDFPLSYERR